MRKLICTNKNSLQCEEFKLLHSLKRKQKNVMIQTKQLALLLHYPCEVDDYKIQTQKVIQK